MIKFSGFILKFFNAMKVFQFHRGFMFPVFLWEFGGDGPLKGINYGDRSFIGFFSKGRKRPDVKSNLGDQKTSGASRLI